MIAADATVLPREAAARRERIAWHILTGEYPPQPGGVSDYTRRVAAGLADAGDRVIVYAPPCGLSGPADPGVDVRRLPDSFGPRSLSVLGREFDRAPGPKRWLVQYVPQAFGWKGANLPFCAWLRSRRRDAVWIMFHEVAYPGGAGRTVAENALAIVTRGMAAIAGRAAERVFVSIPAWRPLVESLAGRRVPIAWMPIVSSVPVADDPRGAAGVRASIAGRPIVGHLGTYGRMIRPLLDACLPGLLRSTGGHLLLLGRGGDAMRRETLARHPEFAGRVHAPGALPEDALSRHVAACDVMLQPYPDGVSTRRTSVMVALSHGRPIVTTSGRLTEPLWAASGALVLVPADRPAELAEATASLLQDRARLEQFATRSRALYAERFDLAHTIDTLRSAGDP